MVIIKRNGNEEIVTQRNSIFLIMGVVAPIGIIMFFLKGWYDIVSGDFNNLRGIVITVWGTLMLLGMTFLGFFNYFKNVVIDESGISSHFLFMHRHIAWHEVVEYGAYQSNNGSHTSQSSVLYFAKKPQLEQRRGRVKLSVDTIRAHLVSDAEYVAICEKVIGYASRFTTVEPYLGLRTK